MSKKAILAGASGLIGNNLLKILLDAPEYTEVLILVRKPLEVQHPKLKQLVLNFDKLNEYAEQLTGTVVFSCLGTTKKKTPDKKEYYKIDHDYPLHLGRIARKNNIAQFHLISSLGADAKSSVSYTRLKGETENDITSLNFPALYIYRPSLLTGDRLEKRSFEKILFGLWKAIHPLLIGSLKKYRSISGEDVARALYKNSLKEQTGKFIYTSDQIQDLASADSLI